MSTITSRDYVYTEPQLINATNHLNIKKTGPSTTYGAGTRLDIL